MSRLKVVIEDHNYEFLGKKIKIKMLNRIKA